MSTLTVAVLVPADLQALASCCKVQHNAAVGALATGETGKPRISVTLDADDLATIQKMAKERDRSLSWFAGHAIRFYLAEMRKGAQLALAFEDPDR